MANFKLSGFASTAMPFIAALALCSAPLGAQSAADAPAGDVTLSLPEVFRLVETRNTTVLAGEEGVRSSEQQVRQSRSALLPQINAEARQGRARSMADQGGRLSPSLGNNFSAGFVANLTLIDAKTIAAYKQAKLEASAARYEQQATLQDVYSQAAQEFYAYNRNLSSMRVIVESIELDRVLLDKATERRKANVATELDVTRAQAALAKDRQSLLSQRTAVDQARVSLLQTIGMDLASRVTLALGEPSAPDLSAVPHWQVVLAERPEYKAAQDLLRRNQVAERAAGWQRFPSLSASGSYGHASWLPGDGNGGEEWAVGISASMPLYEGGRIDAEKMQARALIRQEEQLIKQISDNIHAGYTIAVEAVQHRWDEIALAQESVRLAELELQYARERFEAGVTDNSDVVTAQVSLASAKDSLVDAQHRYQLARIDLARVLGQVQSRLSK
jgi:outer membrane protein TolC